MNFDPDLERLIDRELKALPGPRAPRTLLPRVMIAVHATRPRTSGGWFTWPLVWQISSLAAMLLIILGAANFWPVGAATIVALASNLSADTSSRLGGVIRETEAIVSAADTIWRVAQPVVVGMLVLLATMGAACAMLGAALRSVVLGGASRL
ncbi:MAG: hypothetical protein ACM4AI_26195 [Acidobacteriota bacterium]